jgi:hypothetical protein
VSLVAARRMLVDRCVLHSAGSRFVVQGNKGEHREHLIPPTFNFPQETPKTPSWKKVTMNFSLDRLTFHHLFNISLNSHISAIN